MSKKISYAKTGTIFDNTDDDIPGPADYDTAKYKATGTSDLKRSMLFGRYDKKIEERPAPN